MDGRDQLSRLPGEVIAHIARLSPLRDVARLICVCAHLRASLMASLPLWQSGQEVRLTRKRDRLPPYATAAFVDGRAARVFFKRQSTYVARLLKLEINFEGGEFPDGLSRLTDLEDLDVRGMRGEAARGISALTRLTSLQFDECEDLVVPMCISSLTNLRRLGINIVYGKNPVLPRCITALSRLESLQLVLVPAPNYDRRVRLPDGITALVGLKHLDLTGFFRVNGVEHLMQGIGGLTNLVSLRLAIDEVTGLPPNFRDLTNLQELVLEACDNLTTVPDGVQHLPRLGRLLLPDI